MSLFTNALGELLSQGCVRFSEFPQLNPLDESTLHGLLRSAFELHLLDIAGPTLLFQEKITLTAAEFLLRACWFLVHRGVSPEDISSVLKIPPPPRNAAEHLSADVIYRFLAGVHRRAQAIDPKDILTLRIEEVLRKFPLSGVLSSVDDPPTTPVHFDKHPGLLMLFAERLARHPRRGWIVTGPAREYIEYIYHKKGLELPEEVA